MDSAAAWKLLWPFWAWTAANFEGCEGSQAVRDRYSWHAICAPAAQVQNAAILRIAALPSGLYSSEYFSKGLQYPP